MQQKRKMVDMEEGIKNLDFQILHMLLHSRTINDFLGSEFTAFLDHTKGTVCMP